MTTPIRPQATGTWRRTFKRKVDTQPLSRFTKGSRDLSPAAVGRPPRYGRKLRELGVEPTVQGRYAAAQPLYEKALEINRRVRSDDHPATAATYNSLALNLNAQGKYAAAQPLLEKALEI